MFYAHLKICSRLMALMFFASLLFPCNSAAVDYILTLQNFGAGSGNINGSVSYIMNPGASFQNTVAEGTSVILTQNSDWRSVFDGWGAPCSGTGTCTFTINSNVAITANFSLNKQALIVGHTVLPEYATLAEAYAAANDQSTIAANVYTFHETLTLSRPIFVRLYLGKDAGFYYSTPVGLTTLVGNLSVTDGSAEVDALVIQGSLTIGQGSMLVKSLVVK